MIHTMGAYHCTETTTCDCIEHGAASSSACVDDANAGSYFLTICDTCKTVPNQNKIKYYKPANS